MKGRVIFARSLFDFRLFGFDRNGALCQYKGRGRLCGPPFLSDGYNLLSGKG